MSLPSIIAPRSWHISTKAVIPVPLIPVKKRRIPDMSRGSFFSNARFELCIIKKVYSNCKIKKRGSHLATPFLRRCFRHYSKQLVLQQVVQLVHDRENRRHSLSLHDSKSRLFVGR